MDPLSPDTYKIDPGGLIRCAAFLSKVRGSLGYVCTKELYVGGRVHMFAYCTLNTEASQRFSPAAHLGHVLSSKQVFVRSTRWDAVGFERACMTHAQGAGEVLPAVPGSSAGKERHDQRAWLSPKQDGCHNRDESATR